MKDAYPMLFERVSVGPRVHKVFSSAGLAMALGLVLALVAVGDGELGQRFARAFGKGLILVVFAGAYFVFALTQSPKRDPAWKALVAGTIQRVSATGSEIEPCVAVETTGGERHVVSCQNKEQQAAIFDEFRRAGTVEVAADAQALRPD